MPRCQIKLLVLTLNIALVMLVYACTSYVSESLVDYAIPSTFMIASSFLLKERPAGRILLLSLNLYNASIALPFVIRWGHAVNAPGLAHENVWTFYSWLIFLDSFVAFFISVILELITWAQQPKK